jgi:hypothetical protein
MKTRSQGIPTQLGTSEVLIEPEDDVDKEGRGLVVADLGHEPLPVRRRLEVEESVRKREQRIYPGDTGRH